ncbi:DUF3265 domain-containing protein [Vibrio sp. 070316B]|nr:DUF3265 domain-containing protein [Vibrio sp. 070316B]NOI39216.1 DUF3265 domain-containing protein [Vibrio sp. 070316B]
MWETHITIRLRLIRNAWYFHYALRFVLKVVCGNFVVALLTPKCGVRNKVKF